MGDNAYWREHYARKVSRLEQEIIRLKSFSKVADSPLLDNLRAHRRDLMPLSAKPIDTWTGRDQSIAHLCVLAVIEMLHEEGSGW